MLQTHTTLVALGYCGTVYLSMLPESQRMCARAVSNRTRRRRAAGCQAVAEEIHDPRPQAEAPQQRGGLRGADPRPRALDPASQLLAPRPNTHQGCRL